MDKGSLFNEIHNRIRHRIPVRHQQGFPLCSDYIVTAPAQTWAGVVIMASSPPFFSLNTGTVKTITAPGIGGI
jgi:hypothetical protein